MRNSQIFAMASALLLAAGCAHDQQNARYDESISPGYSAGRMTDYSAGRNDPAPAAYSGNAGVNAAAGKTRSQSDNTIVTSVRESLLRNAEIAPIVPEIQINANNGAVILSGSVQSEEQRRQIGEIALQANGVVAVNNQLQIISTPAPRDTSTENQPGNPLLNPTSNGSNNPPALYQDAGSSEQNSNTNALTLDKLNSTSTASNGLPRLYQNAGGSMQNGQPQTTNSNESTTDNPMH